TQRRGRSREKPGRRKCHRNRHRRRRHHQRKLCLRAEVLNRNTTLRLVATIPASRMSVCYNQDRLRKRHGPLAMPQTVDEPRHFRWGLLLEECSARLSAGGGEMLV